MRRWNGFTDDDGVYAYRPVRDANCAHYRYAQPATYEDGQAFATWGTGPCTDRQPVTVSMIETAADGTSLIRAAMPYLDIGTLLFDGAPAIEAAAQILSPYGELLPARTADGREDLAVFHAFGLIDRGDDAEHVTEYSYAVHLHISPKDPLEIRRLGAFRHVVDPGGAVYLSDELVMKLGSAGLIQGTTFRICPPIS